MKRKSNAPKSSPKGNLQIVARSPSESSDDQIDGICDDDYEEISVEDLRRAQAYFRRVIERQSEGKEAKYSNSLFDDYGNSREDPKKDSLPKKLYLVTAGKSVT